jgi:carboxyvinyl-carboxyphosphonate phosphorylmutase
VLGAPDLIVLTLSEFAHQAYRIGRAAELALMCDAEGMTLYPGFSANG